MDGLSELVKHITVSRSLTGAALVTSTVLLFGPWYFPEFIPPVPSGWGWAVLAVFTFSAALIAFWTVAGIWRHISNAYEKVRGLLPLSRPTSEEELLLYVFADRADEVVNLEDLYRRTKGEVPKLVLLDWAKRLCKKGYVREIGYDENLLTLTHAGRDYCLHLLERRQKAGEKP